MSSPLPWSETVKARIDEALPSIHRVFNDANAVGMSIGVFNKEETLKELHLGFRDVGSKIVADRNTRYSMNSMTKGLVGALVGMAYSEGMVDLYTTPIRTYLPMFESSDPIVQREATIIDFLSHRTGIQGNDTYWFGSQNQVLLSRSELLRSFATLKLQTPFRTSFGYNNWGYDIVALVLETVYEKTFAHLLQEKIFGPLGMTRSGTNWGMDDNEIKAYAVLQDGSPVEIVPSQLAEGTLMEAAGGGKSTLGDLLVYYKAYLCAANDQFQNGHDHTEGSIFKHLRTLMSAHISLPGPVTLREQSYGVGWVRCQLPGPLGRTGMNSLFVEHMPVSGEGGDSRLDLHHHGLMPGSLSVVHLLPEAEIGIVILQNSTTSNDTADLISLILIQAMFPCPKPIDFERFGKAVSETSINYIENLRRKLEDERGDKIVKPGRNEDYIGTYSNAINNFIITILEREGSLKIQFQGRDDEVFDMQHYNGDAFTWLSSHDDLVRRGRLVGNAASFFVLRFRRNRYGSVKSVGWCWSEYSPEVEDQFKKVTL